MKNIILIVTLLFSITFLAQEVGVQREVKANYQINKNSIIFDKDSDKQIKFDEFISLVNSYPNHTIMVKEEDVDGNALSFYFIKNQFKESNLNAESESIEIERKDIFDTLFNLENVDTKMTLIILQLDLQFPRINLEQIKEAEQAAINRGYTSIILTTTNSNLSKDFALEHNLKSIIIPNAQNVMDKFNSKRFPMYYILNKDKSIISTLKYSYEVEDEFKTMN